MVVGLVVGYRKYGFSDRSYTRVVFPFATRHVLHIFTVAWKSFFCSAAFGAEITEPLPGYVIPLSSFTKQCFSNDDVQYFIPDNSGCPDLCVIGPNQPTEPWIALVQRGKCEFVKKVREAQRLGAKAVVVGGEDPELSGYPDTLVNMYSPGIFIQRIGILSSILTNPAEDAADVTIPATYIKYSDYAQLFSLISTSNTTHSGLRTISLLITAEHSAWEWYS